jgi:hypothetical protein
MKNLCVRRGAALVLALFVAGCGGGGGGAPSVNVSVQVSWNANREADVNRPGGGYRVYYSRSSGFNIATASFVDVPYSSGATAPTTTGLTLSSGGNFIRVVAYSDLNPNGSAPSGEINVNVPFGAAP